KLPIGTERMTFFCAAAGMLAKPQANEAPITSPITVCLGQNAGSATIAHAHAKLLACAPNRFRKFARSSQAVSKDE
ncbi:MAG TPA: hypothetical protein VMR94_13235, partial [Hyphomicrobiaceae bacterium]|nr:hypothetical protein [Hyphomicrobiaceae bacterium]